MERTQRGEVDFRDYGECHKSGLGESAPGSNRTNLAEISSLQRRPYISDNITKSINAIHQTIKIKAIIVVIYCHLSFRISSSYEPQDVSLVHHWLKQ